MNVSRKNPLIISVREGCLGWHWVIMRNASVLVRSVRSYATKRNCVKVINRVISDLKHDCVVWEGEKPKAESTLVSQLSRLERRQP
jgi:hypothetical protein